MSLILVLLVSHNFSPSAQVLAQVSKGNAGFTSGSGNTTTSGTVFSTPSLSGNTQSQSSSPSDLEQPAPQPLTPEQRQEITEELSTLQQGSTEQQILRNTVTTPLPGLPIESSTTQSFQSHLGLPPAPIITLQEATDFLQQIAVTNNIKPALVYISSPSSKSAQRGFNAQDSQIASTEMDIAQLGGQETDQQLQFLTITPQGALPLNNVPDLDYRQLLRTARLFELNLSRNLQDSSYLDQASQLYEWLIDPILTQLQQQDVDNLTFVLPDGLRTLPLAALYNAKTQRFLIEDYTLGMIPSLSLIELTPQSSSRSTPSKVLAMGSSTFTDNTPLPAVPLELAEVTKILPGERFLDQEFTVNNLRQGLDSGQFNVIHLATHGAFQPGFPSNSFIYFNQGKLNLNQFADLGFDQSKIDLLVLSACQTAFGDPEAELGFAGLAVKAGVRTALGSLWSVSDEGTLALMTLFYNQFKTQNTKTEALHNAQISMLKGDYQILNDQLIFKDQPPLSLSPAIAEVLQKDLRHPYYWSAFTLIGNPW